MSRESRAILAFALDPMSQSANVHSLEAIDAVKTALVLFADRVEQALVVCDSETQRVLDWLEHDRPRYWKSRVRLATDEVGEAQRALHRCLMYPIADERPSCREERAAVQQAQAQLAHCEAKARRLKDWAREVRHEMYEYNGQIGQLKRLTEIDVPKAVALLSKLVKRIEEYRALEVRRGRRR